MKKILTLTISLALILSAFGKSGTDSLVNCTGYFEYEVIINPSYSLLPEDSVLVNFYSFCDDETAYHMWDFGDSSYSSEANPSHYYLTDNHVYSACHSVMNGYTDDFICKDIVIIPGPPMCKADFSFWEDTLVDCDCIGVYHFVDQSVGDVVSWHWYFGDGEESTEQNPVHHFQMQGAYKVILGIETSDGCTSSIHKWVFVGYIDCTIKISWEMMETAWPQYQFYNDVFDPRNVWSAIPPPWDSTWHNMIIYKWDFGDGDSSSIPFPVHAYEYSDTYTVSLEVTYHNGTTCKTSVTDYFYGKEINPCIHTGTYYTPNDICDHEFIITDEGEKLAIKNFNPKIDVYDGLRLKFGYTTLPDSDFYCEGASKLVNIMCAEPLVSTCELKGTVWDYSWLDGCNYIIELDNGKKLEPVLVDTPFVFRDNQRVRLSYRELTEWASICMVGITAEITCIEEIGDTIWPPPWEEGIILLETSYEINGPVCSGSAWISIILPCRSMPYYDGLFEMGYTFLWSTGETTSFVTGLCPNNLYFVTVTSPSGKVYTAAFSIFVLNNFVPAWQYIRYNNTYNFMLPVPWEYSVEWKINNNVSLYGSNVTYTFMESGTHVVELIVRDETGMLVYSENIFINVATGIPEIRKNNIKVYPQPVEGILNIEFEAGGDYDAGIQILNLAGQAIYNTDRSLVDGLNHISLDLHDLDPGMYILVINTPQGIIREKISK